MIKHTALEHSGVFLLNTMNGVGYGMNTNVLGDLIHSYWGRVIDRLEDIPSATDIEYYRLHRNTALLQQEYPGWGGAFYSEPALKVRFPDGVRATSLKFSSYEIKCSGDTEELIVFLEDATPGLKVALHYRIFQNTPIIERHAVITNAGAVPVTLESAQSACFHLPHISEKYRITYLTGRWGHEFTIQQHVLTQGKTVLENRTGLSTTFMHPYCALDDGAASEHLGRVYFCTLLYNGNWKIVAETDPYERVAITGGIHDFDFSWPLKPGDSFVTPVFVAGISDEGFGGANRILHNYQRHHVASQVESERIMPVLFNSWSSMGADVNDEKILAIAEKAAEIGAELFVIDDGWQKALGDWIPDIVKFPHGLRPIVEKVKTLGMDFGLWVEVESFELTSDLYREHPEWAMHFPQREVYKHFREDVNRTSVLINFARLEVAEYMLQALRRLVRETGITYLKLDMNYHFTTPGWSDVLPEEQQTIWVRYARNVTYVFQELKKEFPNLLIENCAAGGGRSDLSMDAIFGRINRSDNQDTLDAIKMHEGFTMLHPSKMAGGACHISTSIYGFNHRITPLQMQAYAGMMGSLAIGENLLDCTEEKKQQIVELILLHKKLRPIIQLGNLYKLASLYHTAYSAFEFVSPDRREAVLFVFGQCIQFQEKIPPFRLRGLNGKRLYKLEIHGSQAATHVFHSSITGAVISGQALMEIGVRLELLGDYDSRIIHLKAI